MALITGITGQDGAYLAEFLLDKGYIVHGIKRLLLRLILTELIICIRIHMSAIAILFCIMARFENQ